MEAKDINIKQSSTCVLNKEKMFAHFSKVIVHFELEKCVCESKRGKISLKTAKDQCNHNNKTHSICSCFRNDLCIGKVTLDKTTI